MSRHRKVKALDYDEEYDDYYGALDDEDDDFDGDAFEAQYLGSGIDLNTSDGNDISKANECRRKILDDINQAKRNQPTPTESKTDDLKPSDEKSVPSSNQMVNSITSDLTKIAIQHLDKHQWQLPLMEMDKKFRDKTYYKHYSDSYISSLRSKLGHFIADKQLLLNPMKYHMRQEIDNYSKYSKMFELLEDYYQSIGSGFFSFSTPSPDEEIVIGCRMGTKVKKPVAKQVTKNDESHKTTRFEYTGKSASDKASSKVSVETSNSKVSKKTSQAVGGSKKKGDFTVQENFNAERLDKLAKNCEDSLQIGPKTKKASKPSNISPKKEQTSFLQSSTKQLSTLTEKRNVLKEQLKRSMEPSAQEQENFKKQAVQTRNEYEELSKCTKAKINLIVVGHVDAGKSTLVGHLLFKLGQINGKQMHRYEVDSQRSGKSSFKFAWALDETDEERSRGVTIDIAATQFETPNRDIVLLDAPGHVDFVPAVISGAAQADAALLVVDATRGEFETGFSNGGQTREHTFLIKSLGAKSLIVVVNKMDTVNWSRERYNDIVEQLKPFLRQAGFNLDKDVQFVACSGLTGDNLIENRMKVALKGSSHPQLECDSSDWSRMPSLLEAIDTIAMPERLVDKPTRICVTDIFKGMSSGVSLGAKVVAGKLEAKQKLLLLPPNETCEVKQVEVRGVKENRAFAGDIVTTIVTGVDMNIFHRGCVLCYPLIPCKVTNRFQARIIMFQNANTILLKGSPIEVHINGTFESGVVRHLISLLNKTTGEVIQRRPRCIVKSSSAIVQLKLARVVCCELYEDNKDLGRFMLRAFGKTIAAGLITKTKPAKLARKGGDTKMTLK